MDIEYKPSQLLEDVKNTLSVPSPFQPESYLSEEFAQMYLTQGPPVLVVGAGGLGCELLKNLCLLGLKEIHVIDLDTIDLTNLNRQFLFRLDDINKYKSQVAAQFIMKRFPEVKVIPHTGKIQDKKRQFYEQFPVIIAGLDNVDARRWLNALVHQMVEFDDQGNPIPESQRVLIDGGTETFNGQTMYIKPYETRCYECILGTLPKQRVFNSCTIARTPRIPQHCIQYVFEIQWAEHFPQRKVDCDSKDDVKWIYERAKARADQFNIKGVTEMLTLGVIKNIIPAIASTNALIAASSANEAFKALTGAGPNLKNTFVYFGTTYIGGDVLQIENTPNCPICSKKPNCMNFPKNGTLQQLIEQLAKAPFSLGKISMIQTDSSIYLVSPMIENTKNYLTMTMQQLIGIDKYKEGERLHITYRGQSGTSSIIIKPTLE